MIRDEKENGRYLKAIKKDYSAPKAKQYAEMLDKIKELGQFFIAGIRCTVTKIEGNVVHYTRFKYAPRDLDTKTCSRLF